MTSSSRRCALAILVIFGAASCSSTNGTYAGGDATFTESSRAHSAMGSRSVLALASVRHMSDAEVPTVVQARIVGVSPDRGWVNLDESEIRDGIDSREVAFDDPDAHFRTIRVDLDIDRILRAGGMISSADARRRVDAAEVVTLTMTLHNDTSLESAREELLALDDVVVPIIETDRGAFGRVIEPYGGGDLILDVGAGQAVSMPLAAEEIRQAVLGSVRTLDGVAAAVRRDR